MSPVLRGAHGFSTGSAAAQNTSVTFPTSLGLGDFMFIFGGNNSASATTWSCSAPVSGNAFTAVTAVAGAATQQQLLYKTADSQDVTNAAASTAYTVAQSVSHFASYVAGAYSSAGGLDPVPSVSGQINASSTTLAVASITTTIDGDMLVWAGYSTIGAGGTPATITVPSGFTARTTQSDANTTGTGGSTNVGMLMGDATQATHGATGAENGTLATAHVNGGILFALSATQVAGTASLTGTGSLAAAPILPATATLAGTGVLTAAPTVITPSTGGITVGTTPVQIAGTAPHPGSRWSGSLRITNSGAAAVYLGAPNVTSSNGFPVAAGATWPPLGSPPAPLFPGDQVWACTASGTSSVQALQTGGN